MIAMPTLLSGCTNDDRYWNQNENTIALKAIIDDVERLEEISKSYKQASYEKRVLIFVRCKRYNGTLWNIAGGSLETDFEGYVAEHQGEDDLFYLQTTNSIVDIVTEKSVDFVHQFACMNLAYQGKGAGDLGGWAGDLCQLAQEVKNSTADKTYKQIALDLFNKNSSFGSEDVLADVDGANIMTIYTGMENKSISKAMAHYYKKMTNKIRFAKFNSYLFDESNIQNKYEFIYNRMNNNYLISALCASYDINMTNDKAIFDACIEVFVDYVISQL